MADTPTYESLVTEVNRNWVEWLKKQGEPVRPDLALLGDYGHLTNGNTTIRRYSNGNKHLDYINASHGPREKQPETHQRIREAIELLKPDRIILEGTPHPTKPLPLDSKGMNESDYAVALAHAHHIPIVWGEPSEAARIAHLTSHGFSTKDVMAGFLVGALPGIMETFASKNGKTMSLEEAEAAATRYFTQHSCFDSIPPSERLTLEEFKAHYAPILGNKSLTNINRNDGGPSTDPEANIFRRMSAISGTFRDQTIVERTAAALNETAVHTVLKIYGDSHRQVQDAVWNAALGQGVDIEPIKCATHKVPPSAAR